jgi:hypothetical protein
MIIKVTYNKSTGAISITNDMEDVAPLEVNTNATLDTVDSLYFEVSLDTTSYEQANQAEDYTNTEVIE